MEDLPDHLVVDILSRLTDSADLARSRVACRSFNSLSRHVKSLTLLCSAARYRRSRSPATRYLTTPFKSIVRASVIGPHGAGSHLESVSIRVEEDPELSYDDVGDESEDDLYVTDVGFLRDWLPLICDGLRELSISDFWVQSCWRRSTVLGFVSSCCHNLVKLELKKAWLSVEGLTPLPKLTSLTLEFIRLEDEDLNRINTCFPSLEILNLLGVGGLKDPKIQLLHLKTCQWTVSNVPVTLSIFTPSLEKLKLRCLNPRSLIIEAPLLSDFNLSIVQADSYDLARLSNLRSLQLSSPNLHSVIEAFSSGVDSVENLTLNSVWTTKDAHSMGNVTSNSNREMLFQRFPRITSLTVGPGMGLEGVAWNEMLKRIVLLLALSEIDKIESYVSPILNKSRNLDEMTILVHKDADSKTVRNALLRLSSHWSWVTWRSGFWKEADEDAFDPYGWDIVGRPHIFK